MKGFALLLILSRKTRIPGIKIITRQTHARLLRTLNKQYMDKQYMDKQYMDKQYMDKQYMDKQYMDKQYMDKQYMDKQYMVKIAISGDVYNNKICICICYTCTQVFTVILKGLPGIF